MKHLRSGGTAAAVLVVMWSSGFVGAALGTREAPALTLLAWRYLAAAAVLLLACAVLRPRTDRRGIARQAVLGLLVQTGYLGFVVTGVDLGVSPGTASLVAALQPLVVVLLAAVFLGEPTRRGQVLGLVVGLLGVVLVVLGDLGLGGAPRWAFALPVLAMLSLAVGTVLEQRWRPSESLVAALTLQTLTATVVFWIAATATGAVAPPPQPAFWGAVAWVVVLSTFGGYGAYVHVTRTQGATRASTLLYLTPPTTMVWAAVMLHAPITVQGVVGLGVCACGVALALRRPRTPEAQRSGDDLGQVHAQR